MACLSSLLGSFSNDDGAGKKNRQLRKKHRSGATVTILRLIIPSCLHVNNVNEEPFNWISVSAVKVNTQS